MTVEQLEAARAERMRQDGHGAITIEDIRTWIEETGLCIFMPRSAQTGFTAPTFIEAIVGQRTTEPTAELISTAESLLVRLEAEGVAVRLNLAGQPLSPSGDMPDYVVAAWVLPYIYALRGDRDWRRSPQLTGSRQVSPLAIQAAKQIDTGNQTAMQIRDALGREVTETAVFRALHELWKQLRIIPVVPQVGQPGLWQPLRQRFQKAIAEGASTSQVTAISVLASIYLQAVVAASMEDIEMFLSPLTSRSKIREVVRGLAATRQVHTTTLGHSPMFYVAGTLPEFPVAPSFQINTSYPPYRGSSYLGLDRDQHHDEDHTEDIPYSGTSRFAAFQSQSESEAPRLSPSFSSSPAHETTPPMSHTSTPAQNGLDLAAQSLEAEVEAEASLPTEIETEVKAKPLTDRQKPLVDRSLRAKRPVLASAPVAKAEAKKGKQTGKPAAPRPRSSSGRASTLVPRGRSSNVSSEIRGNSSNDRRRSATSRAPAPRSGNPRNATPNGTSSTSTPRPTSRKDSSRPASGNGGPGGNGNGNHGKSNPNHSNGYAKSNGNVAKASSSPAIAGKGANSRPRSSSPSRSANRPEAHVGARNASAARPKSGPQSQTGQSKSLQSRSASRPLTGNSNGHGNKSKGSASSSASRNGTNKVADRELTKTSSSKRYGFSGQAPKTAPKPVAKHTTTSAKPAGKAGPTSGSKRTTASTRHTSSRSAQTSAAAKRRG